MVEEYRKGYNRDSVVFRAGRETGVSDRVGSHLDVLPVWSCDEAGNHRLNVILYGLRLGSKEWASPQGIICDAAGTPTLKWLPGQDEVGKPLPWRAEGEVSKWRPFHRMDDEWWDARERIIGCCERVGDLFRQRDKNLCEEDVALLHQVSADYQLLLPLDLLEECRRMYPSFFKWLAEWL